MDKVLKQRLVGAAILIALAVIFVPLLFEDGSQREGMRDSSIELPPPPSDRREVRRLPLDPQQAREVPPPPELEMAVPERSDGEISLLEPARVIDDEPAVSDALAAGVPEADLRAEPEPESEPLPEPPVEPEPGTPAVSVPVAAPPDQAADSASAFIVQVASFSASDTADQISEQLGSLGHRASVDLIVRGASQLHRVRTGPYASRAEADRARAQISATVGGVEPVVLAAPEGLQAAPERAAGLSVQVGSFTARVNADRLTEQLQAQGFDAFIHSDATGNREIWRVRVGSLSSREDAAALRNELLDRAGLEGLIVNHP